MNIVEAARTIAHHWHNEVMGQLRKYTGQPYTDHTDEVANTYATYFRQDLVGQAAAHLHDTVEDTGVTTIQLLAELHSLVDSDQQYMIPDVIFTVKELTDVFTPEIFKELTREERKTLERERLGKTSLRAQNIKVCDLLSNTRDIVKSDPDFAPLYLREKIALMNSVKQTDSRLRARIFAQILAAQAKLGIIKHAILI